MPISELHAELLIISMYSSDRKQEFLVSAIMMFSFIRHDEKTNYLISDIWLLTMVHFLLADV